MKTTHKTRNEEQKRTKKMICHPQMPKQYAKSRTGDDKKMTRAVRKAIEISKQDRARDK